MKQTFCMLGICAGLLSGCANIDATLQDVARTASGRITEVRSRVDGVIQPVVETIETANKRIKQVQSGAALIREGIEGVQEGMGR